MKRITSVVVLTVLLAGAASAQTAFDTFSGALKTFSGSMAGALALGSSTGATWSDAYTGGFPRFGVGLAVGATTTGKGSVDPLFTALGQSVPAGLDTTGVPIPAMALSAKIGLPILPLDVGIYGGVIPASTGASLKGLTGVSVDYLNIGGQARFALLKENILFPDLSLGAGVSYQKGSVSAPLGVGSTTLVDEDLDPTAAVARWVVSASDPALSLAWEATNFDFTLQVSKSLLILRPYAGLGLTMGSTSVTGGVESKITATKNGAAASTAALSQAITDAGGKPPSFSAVGYTYTTTATDPIFRLYGGFSFEILVLKFDTQVIYAPSSGNMGASFMARLQI